ncbi:hypothetical protein [Pseudomonas aeruginosa]|uniref:hypothetical protein n=1 Tax=Pseudomonas aeruginosa TaxID=287 RepID=UPI00051F241D|nr:hypothetical protein [Pseudomonas aeruginosa]RCI50809.1 hypothetical protein DT379_15660 [Pseudomonas aeruginosa]RWX99576.1 hypothetical protein EQH80_32420 [Pseudomonas aeruginosa]RWY15205.1 hypothetical protein EQH75_32040 [Pseudomonas aeruginosa]RWY93502.1 hypothetical protein EQH73_16940 [Pseudomonas aeruginosa]CDM54063.1 hypothetical protein PAWS394_5220 [Pseudomonas aeruginosa WS394]
MPTINPARGRQVRPTKQEVSAAWSRLRAAAELGSPLANALLIALADRPISQHTDSGVINLPGHGGWRGEPNDPLLAILASIRESDPSSSQLPENQQ